MDPLDPKPYFKHPKADYNIYATLDICHMLKLARNSLAELKTFFTSSEERICWQYIADLADIQNNIGLRLGNKLTSRHANWQKQKMKVKLAAQTFRLSVGWCSAVPVRLLYPWILKLWSNKRTCKTGEQLVL